MSELNDRRDGRDPVPPSFIPDELLEPGLKDLIDLCPGAAREVIADEIKRLISEYAVRSLFNLFIVLDDEIRQTNENIQSMMYHAAYLAQVEQERRTKGEPTWREDPHGLI